MARAPSKVPRLYIRMRIFFVLSVEPEGRPSMNNLLGSVGVCIEKGDDTYRRRGNEDRQVY